MIKVMVADDNIDLNSMCCKFLTKDKNIEVISQTMDGETTLKNYLELQPDLLILDLDMPKKSGLEIINELSLDTKERNKCNIIVISGKVELMHILFNTAKVYRIIPKPASFDDILQTVMEFEKGKNKQEIPEEKIRELLLTLNIQPYSTGGKCITKAINIIIHKPDILNNIEDLYLELSLNTKFTYGEAKWGIRNAIDTMNRNMTPKDFFSLFHIYTSSKSITPKIFFTVVPNYFVA